MGVNLTNLQIANTYQDLLQISGSVITDGLGNEINVLTDSYTKTQSDARYLGILAKAADSNLVDGFNPNTGATGNTIALRDSSGDITTRLFRSEYDTTNSNIGFIMTQVNTGADNYIRPSTPAQFRASITEGSYVSKVNNTGISFNGTYLQWSGDGGSNNDYIGFNDSTNTFVFNADTTKQTATGNAIVRAATFNEGGTNLSSKYLGISGTAANAQLLDGVNSTSFLRSDISDQLTAGTLTINDNARIGFGTSNGEGTLWSNGSATYWDMGADKDLIIRDVTATRFTFDSSNGSFTSTGNITANSDIRLKKNIRRIDGALDKVRQLNGYTWTRKDTGEVQTGVIAQELQKVLPEAVNVGTDEDKTLSVAYGNIVGLLIESIKELNREIELLKGID